MPAWLGLYRRLKPEGGESISILWQRGRALRGAKPLVQGVPPLRAALITEAAQLDPSARYVARLWMAWERRRLAIRGKDSKAKQAAEKRAAEKLWNWLLASTIA